MKSLSQHIKDNKSSLISLNEKLIVNKNYKNVDGLEELFDNIDFNHYDKYELSTRDNDIYSIMVDYICDHTIRRFSDFDSYVKTSRENNNACLVVFNKRIKEIDIFQKIPNDNYKVFIIFKTSYADRYIFKRAERSFTSMHVLINTNTWNNADEVEYYEISEETFDDISELYNKLITK